MCRPSIFIVNAILYFIISACLLFVLVDDLTSKPAADSKPHVKGS